MRYSRRAQSCSANRPVFPCWFAHRRLDKADDILQRRLISCGSEAAAVPDLNPKRIRGIVLDDTPPGLAKVVRAET